MDLKCKLYFFLYMKIYINAVSKMHIIGPYGWSYNKRTTFTGPETCLVIVKLNLYLIQSLLLILFINDIYLYF